MDVWMLDTASKVRPCTWGEHVCSCINARVRGRRWYRERLALMFVLRRAGNRLIFQGLRGQAPALISPTQAAKSIPSTLRCPRIELATRLRRQAQPP